MLGEDPAGIEERRSQEGPPGNARGRAGRRGRGRRKGRRGGGGRAIDRAARPKSSYRLYVERCAAAGREPMGFEGYLSAARRWRTGYRDAVRMGDLALAGELEELLREEPGHARREALR